MEAHQETSPTLHREGQECSTKEQTEDMEAHQRTHQAVDRKGQKCSTKELTEVLKKRERVHAEETKDETIEKLQKQLDKARIKVNELTEENQTLKAKKLLSENNKESVEAEMDEKNKKEEELKAKIKELKQQLADLLKERRKDLQQSGEICEMNCVLSCLVCACQLKMQNVHLCYDHLGRIIMHGEEKIRNLRCGAYLSVLRTIKIVKKEKKIPYSADAEARDKQIDEIWEILKTTTGARIMILGRKMVAKERHTLLCDVEDRKEEDKLAFYDLQRRKWGRGTKENLKDYLKEDTGINLYTINLDSLKKLIEEKRDLDDETCCKSGISNDWMKKAVDIFRNNRTGLPILSV